MANFFSYYNPPGRDINVKALEFFDKHDDFLVMGDFNSIIHNLDGRSSKNGRIMQDFLDKSRCFIMNEPQMPTYFRLDKVTNVIKYKSTLDLFMGDQIFKTKKRIRYS